MLGTKNLKTKRSAGAMNSSSDLSCNEDEEDEAKNGNSTLFDKKKAKKLS